MNNQVANNDFEKMMEERIRKSFSKPADSGNKASNQKLQEMSKRLPEWSLEPPFTFLK